MNISSFLIFGIVLVGLEGPLYSEVRIDANTAQRIQDCLKYGTAGTVCTYPQNWMEQNASLSIAHNITWATPATLQLISKEDIVFEAGAAIMSQGTGSVILKTGMENERNRKQQNQATGRVVFKDESQHIFVKDASVRIYYNPARVSQGRGEKKYKYWNSLSSFYEDRVVFHGKKNFRAYMMVNHARDLQDIKCFLSGSYALSQNLDMSETQKWEDGKGFAPLKTVKTFADKQSVYGFSGDFDGNGYTVSNLYINRPQEDHVGLFGRLTGVSFAPSRVSNLILENFHVTGDHYVGTFAGSAVNAEGINVTILAPKVDGRAFVGGAIGSATNAALRDFIVGKDPEVISAEYFGQILGWGEEIRWLYPVNTTYGRHMFELLLETPCEIGKEGHPSFLHSVQGSYSMPVVFYIGTREVSINRCQQENVENTR